MFPPQRANATNEVEPSSSSNKKNCDEYWEIVIFYWYIALFTLASKNPFKLHLSPLENVVNFWKLKDDLTKEFISILNLHMAKLLVYFLLCEYETWLLHFTSHRFNLTRDSNFRMLNDGILKYFCMINNRENNIRVQS